MLTDSFGRIHDYLRISITDSCNLRCFYCMPHEEHVVTPSAHLMQLEEIYQIASLFVSMGVKKIRLTGGEPLVRKDAAEIIERLAALPVELSLTTNGVRLREFLPVIRSAGMASINVSLDTLDQEKFRLMTRRDHYDRVLENILTLAAAGIRVKVNMVVMRNINHREVNAFVALTRNLPLDVRFIEFMPFAGNHWENEKVYGWQEMLTSIQEQFETVKLSDGLHDTARKYKVPGYMGSFGFIATITSPFCGGCNRLRLTADGKMKNCLFSPEETDLLGALRRGEQLVPLIQQCVQQKAAERGGQFDEATGNPDIRTMKNRSMIAIGG